MNKGLVSGKLCVKLNGGNWVESGHYTLVVKRPGKQVGQGSEVVTMGVNVVRKVR